MPIFECKRCGCIENTAMCGYWWNTSKGKKALCSECDPNIGEWHGAFDKRLARGMSIGADGFLYSPVEKPHHTEIIGTVE